MAGCIEGSGPRVDVRSAVVLMGGTLTSSVICLSWVSSTTWLLSILRGRGGPFLCWGELERAGDGWRAVGTLLGPERTGEGMPEGVLERVSFSGLHLFLHQPAGPVLAGRVGGGSGCCLRTAQWTRASLWLSF